LFWDDAEGGWFSTTSSDPTVPLRLKEDSDGAEQSARSVSALNCLTLAHLTGDDAYRVKADRTLARYGPRVGAAGRVVPMMLCALAQRHASPVQVVITGAGSDPARPLEVALAARYLPFAVHVPVTPATQERLARLLPFVAAMPADTAAVYVCRDFVCLEPARTVVALEEALR